MVKSKQQKYWFKQQSYIWQPIAWQGWLTLALFILVVVGNAFVVVLSPYSNELVWLYMNVLATSVVTVMIVGYTKGPASK